MPAVPLSGSRRRFLVRSVAFTTGLFGLPMVPRRPLLAAPEAMQELIRRIIGDAALQIGKVRLDVPALVENGNTVPLMVSVESPMTEKDHVKAIHIINEKNPQPHVISVRLGPPAGRAMLSTRIKLKDSQQLIAIAETSDGSFWSGTADVIVTLAACVEDRP